ncbi:DUF7426 family protein [Leifsonia sp. 22587]|uniref:DUF7426 family protein n=1 Tax=Leifsonia sp. 22587 TaxID=3453946 RepID=UPI003F8684F3
MSLPDYTDFLDPLELPIRGKKYVIPPMSFETGLRLNALAEGAEDAPKLTDPEFYQMVLGDVYAEMLADKVPSDAIYRACLTAWTEYNSGRAAAEIIWKTGGDPKAIEALMPKPNRASRRKASKPSTRTAAATKTL